MGTRAMILFEGKPLVTTHWDGYPGDLGKQLMKARPKTPQKIFKIAASHSIDWADSKYIPRKPITTSGGYKLVGKKFVPAKKTTYFAHNDVEMEKLITAKVGKDAGTANAEGTVKITTASGKYGDWAEYVYNVHADGTVDVAEASGEWTGKKPTRFTPVKDYLAKKKMNVVS